jgi:hypothetical protein
MKGFFCVLAIYAFLTQALHQALPATCLPANRGQPAALSVALPWYKEQLLQFWSLAYLGYLTLSVFVPSLKYPNALALASVSATIETACALARLAAPTNELAAVI